MPETGVFTAAAQPPSQQATRHARRVYVGGLPPTGNEQNIATFFSNALAAVGGTTAGPGMHKGSSCFGLHPDHPLQSSLCLSVSVCHKICSFPYLPSLHELLCHDPSKQQIFKESSIGGLHRDVH